MKNPTPTQLVIALTIATAWLCAFTTSAEPTVDSNRASNSPSQTSPAKWLANCTAYLKLDYVDSIKSADFLDDNKIMGKFLGFEGDFAQFSRKDSKELIFIPKSAILYMTGKPLHVIF
jgi:hypothetical protein